MGLFDSICNFFNPEIKETYEDLYKNYRKGLEIAFNSIVSHDGKCCPRKFVSTPDLSYSEMKLIYEFKDEIRKLHNNIIQSERIDADYSRLEDLYKLYPHAFVRICDECLGGVIYNETIDMPIDRSLRRGQYGNWIYYHNQYSPIGVSPFQSYIKIKIPSPSEYESEPKNIRSLKHCDVVKVLKRAKDFSSVEENIIKSLVAQNLCTGIIKAEGKLKQNLPTTINYDLRILKECVSNWHTHSTYGSIKHKWFYDYFSYNKYYPHAEYEMKETWKFIWSFKNDPSKHISVLMHKLAMDKAIELVEDTLRETFGNNVSKLTLVCVTASTRVKTEKRFKQFSERVCSDLNMCNAYNHINILSDGEAKHEGGTIKSQKSYDSSWFKYKYVVIFDDIRTSGRSIECERQVLEGFGATVICAITLGQTTN